MNQENFYRSMLQFSIDNPARIINERQIQADFDRFCKNINLLTKAKINDFIEALILDKNREDMVFGSFEYLNKTNVSDI